MKRTLTCALASAHLCMLILALLTPTFARASIEDEAAKAQSCNAGMHGIPNADLIAKWQAETAPRFHAWMKQFNETLPESERLSALQEESLERHFLFMSFSDFMLMKQIEESEIMASAKAADPAYASELQSALATWFRQTADRDLPTREEIKARPFYEPWPNYDRWPGSPAPLNSFQLRLKERLATRQAAVEAKVGMKIFYEDELNYYASSLIGFAEMNRLLDLYAQKKLSLPIIELKKEVAFVLESQRTQYKRHTVSAAPVGADEIAMAISEKHDPEIIAELNYYVELAKVVRNGDLQGIDDYSLATARLKSWQGPKQTVEQTLNAVALDTLRKAYTFKAKNSKGYIQAFLMFSINSTIEEQIDELGAEKVKALSASARWAEAEVSYLGSWELSESKKDPFGISAALGGSTGPKPQTAYIFGVAVPFGNTVKHFAVKAALTFTGDALPLSELTYTQIKRMKVENVREVPREARLQDAFDTVPDRLVEPLLLLTSSSGKYFDTEPNQLLFAEVKPRPGEEDPKSTDSRNRVREISVEHFGGSTKPTVIFRLFRDNKAISLPFKFELESENEHHQVYAMRGAGRFASEEWILDRNLVTQAVKLSFTSRAGIGRFQVTLDQWTGEFVIP